MNAASLPLVRAESRQHEMAIRAALGADWRAIAREMVLESAMLGILGGALGLGLACGALRILVARGPQTLPRLSEIGIDPVVLGFAIVVSLLAGLLFGLIPVLKYAAPQVATALRGVGRSFSHGREHHRARNTLVGFSRPPGTPLIDGRDFTWTDLYDKRRVAIVSENLARELWGSPGAALGKRIRNGFKDDPWKEVVGVAADVYDTGVQEKPPSFAYWPAMMDNFEGEAVDVTRFAVFAVRTKRAATESFLTEARQAIWAVDASVPVFRVQTLKDLYDQSMARTSFTLVMLAIAGGMGLLLGIVGIYGVIAYTVSQRTREIGIRVALGAQASELQRMFVRQALLMAGIGSALEMIAAAGLTRLMSSLLFGITALDPLTYAMVPVFLLAAAALASYVPARRATTVNPVEALRAE
jgi:predicted lysophospholipase L1 biosynthesis ABC-type transport system permease subunit